MLVILNPCPFCGGEANYQIGLVAFNDVTIHCTGCYVQGPTFDTQENLSSALCINKNKKDAAKHWNTRYNDKVS